MQLPLYQIDSFSARVFGGNPAAVCPLPHWLPDATLLAIAGENNLAETAFFVTGDPERRLRWFTPELEVDLCGHATLASAFVLFEYLEPGLRQVTFDSRSGPLSVARDGDLLILDFPARPPQPCETPEALVEGLGARPVAVMRSRDYMAVFETEAEVRALRPRIDLLARVEALGVIATAPGAECDFVSRFFAPRAGIAEDPATGSAHCTLVPYWAEKLGKPRLHALQVSPRVGELFCEARGERVAIAGRAARYLEGTIFVEE